MKQLTSEQLESRKRINKKIIKFGLIPLLSIIIFIVVLSTISDQSNQILVVNNNELDGSVFQVRNYLRANLKDPDSYEEIEWSPVVVDSVAGKPQRFMVRHKYKAKNGLGVYTIENKVFYLDSIGTVYNVLDN